MKQYHGHREQEGEEDMEQIHHEQEAARCVTVQCQNRKLHKLQNIDVQFYCVLIYITAAKSDLESAPHTLISTHVVNILQIVREDSILKIFLDRIVKEFQTEQM